MIIEQIKCTATKHHLKSFLTKQHLVLNAPGYGSGCYSHIGMMDWGRQELNLEDRCFVNQPIGTVEHEFLHALGVYHEHTRPDR